jgi:hypothetical protein
MAVEREESQGLSEFTALVENVVLEPGTDGREQYHLFLVPDGIVVKGKTGKLHEWIGLSKTSGDNSVAKGSVLDLFLRELERIEPAAKKATTVSAEMNSMKGNKYFFQKRELGRAFQGNDAKQYAVPMRKA